MPLLLYLPPSAVAAHLLIAMIIRRGSPSRRLLIALLLLAAAYPLQFLGLILDLGTAAPWLARLCLFAPAILSILSFLVYVPLLNSAHPEKAGSAQEQ